MFCIKFISSLIKTTERITTKPGTQQQSQAEQLVNEWVLERVEANFKEILEFLSKGIMLPSQIKLKLFNKNYRVMFFFQNCLFPVDEHVYLLELSRKKIKTDVPVNNQLSSVSRGCSSATLRAVSVEWRPADGGRTHRASSLLPGVCLSSFFQLCSGEL